MICGIATALNPVGGERRFGAISCLRLRVDLVAEYSPETSVSSYKAKNRHSPEGHSLNTSIYGRDELKSSVICGVFRTGYRGK